MHAIIRLGNGDYYISAVFGYNKSLDTTPKGEHHLSNPYWIVWDPPQKRLIKLPTVAPNIQFLIPQVLIIDSDQHDWSIDESGVGCVNWLTLAAIDDILDMENQPDDVLERCRSIDRCYNYNATPEIKTQKDIDDLEWVSGGFHDAFIEKEKLLRDGTLYIKFNGVWGCAIEIWFWGDVEYNIPHNIHDVYDSCWFSSTIIMKDEFIYLIDEIDMTVDKIRPDNCYFKA